MQKIFIDDLEISASIGCLAFEAKILQKLLLSLEISYDCTKASATDDVQYALNYQELADSLTELTTSKHHNLLENLAGEIMQMLEDKYINSKIHLKINKPGALRNIKGVGVIFSNYDSTSKPAP